MRRVGFRWLVVASAGLTVAGCGVILGVDDFSYVGGAGGSMPPPPGCDPTAQTTAVRGDCGYFVDSNPAKGSDANGKGTQDAPFQTLGKALSAAATAKVRRVYACGETFTEKVTLSTGVDLFGALDCTNKWIYNAAKPTTLTTAADAVPLTLNSGASGSSVHDFAITAAAATKAGGSSIAVIDDHADLTLVNVDLAAGAGSNGAAGALQAKVVTPASANGMDGTDDVGCMNTGIIPGGMGGTNTCSVPTSGGNGGRGLPVVAGDPGLDGMPSMGSSGIGGTGATKTASCNASVTTQPKGADATGAGPRGTGARGIGAIAASGYTGPTGAEGGPGQPGQGGGGGGGGVACDSADNPPKYAGASGGGGGAGGCGGAAGKLGTSGGSSIGILALGAKLTLTTVKISTQVGGAGGVGGDGQLGGPGGSAGHAPVSTTACDGGRGGQGGAGGPGGGGAGGHSVGIAIMGGTLPDLSHTTITTMKTPGSTNGGGIGGGGGDGDTTAQTKGDDGMACRMLDFGSSTSPCSP